jgi:hypothetical protein
MPLSIAIADNTANSDLADKFSEDQAQLMHFPCGMCIHRDKPEHEVCRDCRFYFK